MYIKYTIYEYNQYDCNITHYLNLKSFEWFLYNDKTGLKSGYSNLLLQHSLILAVNLCFAELVLMQ